MGYNIVQQYTFVHLLLCIHQFESEIVFYDITPMTFPKDLDQSHSTQPDEISIINNCAFSVGKFLQRKGV